MPVLDRIKTATKKALKEFGDLAVEALAEADDPAIKYAHSASVKIVCSAEDLYSVRLGELVKDFTQALASNFNCKKPQPLSGETGMIFEVHHVASAKTTRDGALLYAKVHLTSEIDNWGAMTFTFDFIDIATCGWDVDTANLAVNHFADGVGRLSSEFPSITIDGIDL